MTSIVFYTSSEVPEAPYIDLDGSGAETVQSDESGVFPAFWVRVSDQQGRARQYRHGEGHLSGTGNMKSTSTWIIPTVPTMDITMPCRTGRPYPERTRLP